MIHDSWDRLNGLFFPFYYCCYSIRKSLLRLLYFIHFWQTCAFVSVRPNVFIIESDETKRSRRISNAWVVILLLLYRFDCTLRSTSVCALRVQRHYLFNKLITIPIHRCNNITFERVRTCNRLTESIYIHRAGLLFNFRSVNKTNKIHNI